jgi:predicted transposase/invertase (TIGR01784 family)
VLIGVKETAYLYILCEHQSEIDKDIAFRLLVYVIRIIELHRKQNPGGSLPLVYPLVIYSGEKVWNSPTNIFELFGKEKDLAEQIFFKLFQLIDIVRLNDEELKQRL